MFFIITCVLMIASQAIAGMHSLATVTPMAGSVPCSIAGAYLGFRASRRLGDKAYRKLLIIFLGVTGINFIHGVIKNL